MLGKPWLPLVTFTFKQIFTITPVLYCSMIPPLHPVATATAYEDVRYGETVHSEAGVSDSVETRCRDTGIQLAADQLNVPGNLVRSVVPSFLQLCDSQQHHYWACTTCDIPQLVSQMMLVKHIL